VTDHRAGSIKGGVQMPVAVRHTGAANMPVLSEFDQ
jgi:hypothetical protein